MSLKSQIADLAVAGLPPGDDTARIEFLERCAAHAREHGFKWYSFTFQTGMTVREQLTCNALGKREDL